MFHRRRCAVAGSCRSSASCNSTPGLGRAAIIVNPICSPPVGVTLQCRSTVHNQRVNSAPTATIRILFSKLFRTGATGLAAIEDKDRALDDAGAATPRDLRAGVYKTSCVASRSDCLPENSTSVLAGSSKSPLFIAANNSLACATWSLRTCTRGNVPGRKAHGETGVCSPHTLANIP